jgi:hypothetical protein
MQPTKQHLYNRTGGVNKTDRWPLFCNTKMNQTCQTRKLSRFLFAIGKNNIELSFDVLTVIFHYPNVQSSKLFLT